jgi:hypothetical protein
MRNPRAISDVLSRFICDRTPPNYCYAARFAAAACSLVFAIPCANAAELLESVQLVNGGAVLSCDYTHPDDSFTFTCRDAYTVFALRCVSVPWSALRVQRVGQQEFLCPVSTERSAFGNALRLRCSAYGDERRALFARQTLADKAEPATSSGRPYADARLRIGQGGCRMSVSPVPHNKQLQRTGIPNRWRATSAPFHYALAARWLVQRAAAELRR